MKEFAKSFASLGLGMSIFSLPLLSEILQPDDGDEPKGAATRAVDSITVAAVDQLGPTLRATFRVLDNVQRGMTALAFNALLAFGMDRRNELTGEPPPRGNRSQSVGRPEHGSAPEPVGAHAGAEKTAPVAIRIRRQW
jgi:hypothetical protein